MTILTNPTMVKQALFKRSQQLPPRQKVLVVHPHYFDIVYSINPHMLDHEGQLNTVEKARALNEWKALIQAFEKCGLEVEVLDGQFNYPDMVFAANQSFPFWNFKTNKAEAVLANMTHAERFDETTFFANWYQSADYKTHTLPTHIKFEGTGDAISHGNSKIIWCGYGYRTSKPAVSQITEITGHDVIPLELVNPKFYHLDTCFSFLNENIAVAVKEAFTPEGIELIRSAFPEVIYCDESEAGTSLAANLFCPNERDVIIDGANLNLIEVLIEKGFRIHKVETGEFIKAGGSVYCMKLQCW